DSNRLLGGVLMGHVKAFLSVVSLTMLSACGGLHNVGTATEPSTSSARATHTITVAMESKRTPVAASHATPDASSISPADKLIALTFDDGPRPYVLFGSKGVRPTP